MTKSRKDNGILDEFNISFEDILDILKKQCGLCAYSGIKMNYGSILNHNWIASTLLTNYANQLGTRKPPFVRNFALPANYTCLL